MNVMQMLTILLINGKYGGGSFLLLSHKELANYVIYIIHV